MQTRLQSAVRRPLIITTAAALIAGAGAYSVHSLQANGKTAVAAPARVSVFVHTLAPQKVRVWSEFSGRLHAVDAAEIRPEVAGRITAVLFEDGQTVKAGDVLFVIDPRPYEQAVARARANLASAQTNAAFAKTDFDRAATLIKTGAISQRVYDERANAHRMCLAALDAAEAELQRALIDLDRAHVKAPISGRASRAEVTLGNLVQSGPGAPLLTTIVASDSIYADFEVDEQTYVQTIRGVANRREDERRVPVQLTLQSDTSQVYPGYIYTFDNRIDVASGTIRARAKFDNANGLLLPGMFVTVNLADASERDAVLVPDRAVGFDQSKKYVYVVDADNKVLYREVELGRQVQSQRIALKGVEAGDRVIVDGVQRVRPSMVVEVTEAGPDKLAQAATLRSSTMR